MYPYRGFLEALPMVLSRGFLLIRWGAYAISLGGLLGWAADRPLGSAMAEVAETLELLPLGLGTLAVLAGCLVLCFKEEAKRLLLVGAAASAVFLLVIPGLASLTQFGPNIHDWTGMFFFLWLLSCLVAPAILLVGLVRFLLQCHRDRRP